MPRSRVTKPQNIGANRNRAMRNNARRPGVPFQGGLGLNQGNQPGASPQQPRQGTQCPVGQSPQRDPRTGQMRCVPDGQAGQVGPPKPKIRNNGSY